MNYVAYSLASHNALSRASNIDSALESARNHYSINDEFLVVFSTHSSDGIHLFDGGVWPGDARIVWRGGNELAKNYRV